MELILIALIVLCRIDAVIAKVIHVTVGDIGCPGRRTGVTEVWGKFPEDDQSGRFFLAAR